MGVPADLRHASDGGPERSAAGAAKADHVERSRRFGYTVAMAFFLGVPSGNFPHRWLGYQNFSPKITILIIFIGKTVRYPLVNKHSY